jgi:choline monooxygenase
MHECNYNWKTFIEVYLEDYHVAPYHPGLGNFVTCDDLTWQFGDWYSVQRSASPRCRNPVPRPTSAGRRRSASTTATEGKTPEHGAIWLTYYPNIMVEWYPHVLVVSTLIPQGWTRPERRRVLLPRGNRRFRARVHRGRTCGLHGNRIEDDDIGERMDRGRYALLKEGRNEVGPYQSPMEDGMQHFHEFYRRIIMQGHLCIRGAG